MGQFLFALFVVFVSLSWPTVPAQTHHVVGGDSGWTSSYSGRIFRVGDKLSFTYPETDETIVELQNLEDFTSCNLVNPIRMYTDTDRHVTLEKEGIRYFSSANTEKCKNGLKIPVSVQPIPFNGDHSVNNPFEFPPPFWPPFQPEPGHCPPPEHGPPPFEPWPKPFPDCPPPHVPTTPPPCVPNTPPPQFPHSPPPPVPHSPPPPPPVPVPHSPPPPPPPLVPHSPPPPPPVPHSPPPPMAPSASSHCNGFSFMLFAALALCCIGQT